MNASIGTLPPNGGTRISHRVSDASKCSGSESFNDVDMRHRRIGDAPLNMEAPRSDHGKELSRPPRSNSAARTQTVSPTVVVPAPRTPMATRFTDSVDSFSSVNRQAVGPQQTQRMHTPNGIAPQEDAWTSAMYTYRLNNQQQDHELNDNQEGDKTHSDGVANGPLPLEAPSGRPFSSEAGTTPVPSGVGQSQAKDAYVVLSPFPDPGCSIGSHLPRAATSQPCASLPSQCTQDSGPSLVVTVDGLQTSMGAAGQRNPRASSNITVLGVTNRERYNSQSIILESRPHVPHGCSNSKLMPADIPEDSVQLNGSRNWQLSVTRPPVPLTPNRASHNGRSASLPSAPVRESMDTLLRSSNCAARANERERSVPSNRSQSIPTQTEPLPSRTVRNSASLVPYPVETTPMTHSPDARRHRGSNGSTNNSIVSLPKSERLPTHPPKPPTADAYMAFMQQQPVLHVKPRTSNLIPDNQSGVMRITTNTLTHTLRKVRYLELQEAYDPDGSDGDDHDAVPPEEAMAMLRPTQYAQLLHDAPAAPEGQGPLDGGTNDICNEHGPVLLYHDGNRWVRRTNRVPVATTEEPAGATRPLPLPDSPLNPGMATHRPHHMRPEDGRHSFPACQLIRVEQTSNGCAGEKQYLLQRHVQQMATGRITRGTPFEPPRASLLRDGRPYESWKPNHDGLGPKAARLAKTKVSDPTTPSSVPVRGHSKVKPPQVHPKDSSLAPASVQSCDDKVACGTDKCSSSSPFGSTIPYPAALTLPNKMELSDTGSRSIKPVIPPNGIRLTPGASVKSLGTCPSFPTKKSERSAHHAHSSQLYPRVVLPGGTPLSSTKQGDVNPNTIPPSRSQGRQHPSTNNALPDNHNGSDVYSPSSGTYTMVTNSRSRGDPDTFDTGDEGGDLDYSSCDTFTQPVPVSECSEGDLEDDLNKPIHPPRYLILGKEIVEVSPLPDNAPHVMRSGGASTDHMVEMGVSYDGLSLLPLADRHDYGAADEANETRLRNSTVRESVPLEPPVAESADFIGARLAGASRLVSSWDRQGTMEDAVFYSDAQMHPHTAYIPNALDGDAEGNSPDQCPSVSPTLPHYRKRRKHSKSNSTAGE